MLPYLIAGAIGFGIAKLFEEGGETFGRGGMTNEDILRSFLTSNRETQTNNLSTHYNQYDDFLLLRNYSTLIAIRKGNDVRITNIKYSNTTSKITNRLKALAEEMGYSVQYVDKFEGGGELEAIHLQATNLDKKGAESLSEILKKYNKSVRIEKGEDGLYKVYTSSIGGEDEYAGGGEIEDLKSDLNKYKNIDIRFKLIPNDGSEEDGDENDLSINYIGEIYGGGLDLDEPYVELGFQVNDEYAGGGGVDNPSKKEMLDYLNMYFDYYSELRTIAIEKDNILTRRMLNSLDNEELQMAYEDAKYEIKADTQFNNGGGVGADSKSKIKIIENKKEGKKTATQTLVKENNKGEKITYELSAGMHTTPKENRYADGWFEIYATDENDDEYFYSEGGLWIENGRIYDYDGVYELSEKLKPLLSALNLNSEDVFSEGGEAKKRRRRANTQTGKTDMSVDKTRVAKPVGYRFTNSLASKLRKDQYAVPTEKQITKYLGKGIYKENRKNKSDRDRIAKL
jgi:hypothetical protein